MKKCIIVLLMFILAFSIINVSFAKITDFSAYKPSADDSFKDVGSPVIAALQVIAGIVSVGMLALLGIRYMLESPDGRAEIKSKLIPYLIGAVMAFAIIPVLSILYEIFG